MHDFKLFKNSLVYLKEETTRLVDTGYPGGIRKLHGNSEHSKKKSKKAPLTKEDRRRNRHLASNRTVIGNIMCKVKICRSIAEKYWNRRRRFALRFNLIAAIYNLNLSYNLFPEDF
jgi:hypothetical protein